MRVCLALLGLLVATPALASRAPAPGGTVVVHAPHTADDALDRALANTPLIEPEDRPVSPIEAAAWPRLATGQRSRFVDAIAPESRGAAWVLTPSAATTTRALADSITGCLDEGWPSQALAAAGVRAEVTSTPGTPSAGLPGSVRVRLATPVPALPLLLEGCDGPAGAFLRTDEGWVHRPDDPGGRPYLDGVTLTNSPARADLDLSPEAPGGELLVAPWPDVWFLVPDRRAREADPWELLDEDGPARFHDELAADLILAVRRAGRGASTRVLLPPGVAPDRPLAPLSTDGSPPLTLRPLPAGSPTLALVRSTADELGADLEARLALLLRARGWGVADAGPETPSARIVRWRPPTRDPALAVLLLAGEFGFALDPQDVPGLLAEDAAVRASTALTVEQRWLDDRVAVPLLNAARTLSVSPSLRGVRLRGDGLPVLDDAWWVTP